MEKEALHHKPENPPTSATPWESRRKLSEKLSAQTDEFLKRGGRIEFVRNKTAEEILADSKPQTYNNLQPENFARSQKNVAKTKHHNQLNKELARDNGHKTFAGMKCLKCGTYDRWTKTGSCMKCKPDDPDEKVSPKNTAQAAKRDAALSGRLTYIGRECNRCGETERSVDTSYCVKCKR